MSQEIPPPAPGDFHSVTESHANPPAEQPAVILPNVRPAQGQGVGAPGAHGQAGPAGQVDKEFVKSLKGIYRIVEMVLSLVAFICCAVGRNNLTNDWDFFNPPNTKALRGGAGWCMFVTMFSFLVFVITFLLWLFRIFSNLTPKFPIKFMEFITFSIFAGFYLISGIVSASFGKYSDGLAAGAFFTFLMFLVCVTDGYLQYREWASSSEGPYSCCKWQSPGGATAHQQTQQRPPAAPGSEA